MTIVSYAQNLEDVVLWRALGHVRNGFFIDVGAAWPVQDSVTKLFNEHEWRGINIEPNPALYDELCADRPGDVNLPVAVADQRSTLEMEIVPETGLSTLSSELGGKYRSEGRTVSTRVVEVLTLAEIWDEHVPEGQDVHFLKIDVEGFELQVIAGADWQRHRPWVVAVEATAPTSQVDSYDSWEPMIVAAGYEFRYQDGINRFYVAEEHQELTAAFRFPPNVFDGYVTAAHQERERRTAAAEVAAIEARYERDTALHRAELEVLDARHQASVVAESLRRAETHAEWLQTEVDAATSRITAMFRQLGNLDATVAEQERSVASLTQQLHSAMHERAEAHHHRHMATEQLAWYRHEDVALRGEVDRLNEIIGRLEGHIGAMYASTSWRVAKPVRFLGVLAHEPRRAIARLLPGRVPATAPTTSTRTEPSGATSGATSAATTDAASDATSHDHGAVPTAASTPSTAVSPPADAESTMSDDGIPESARRLMRIVEQQSAANARAGSR